MHDEDKTEATDFATLKLQDGRFVSLTTLEGQTLVALWEPAEDRKGEVTPVATFPWPSKLPDGRRMALVTRNGEPTVIFSEPREDGEGEVVVSIIPWPPLLAAV
jgi:hypothetical protein